MEFRTIEYDRQQVEFFCKTVGNYIGMKPMRLTIKGQTIRISIFGLSSSEMIFCIDIEEIVIDAELMTLGFQPMFHDVKEAA